MLGFCREFCAVRPILTFTTAEKGGCFLCSGSCVLPGHVECVNAPIIVSDWRYKALRLTLRAKTQPILPILFAIISRNRQKI